MPERPEADPLESKVPEEADTDLKAEIAELKKSNAGILKDLQETRIKAGMYRSEAEQLTEAMQAYLDDNKKEEVKDEPIDINEDPAGAINKKLEDLDAKLTSREREEAERLEIQKTAQEAQGILNDLNTASENVKELHPEYAKGIATAIQTRAKAYVDSKELSQADALKVVALEIAGLTKQLRNTGLNDGQIVENLYSMAVDQYGFVPEDPKNADEGEKDVVTEVNVKDKTKEVTLSDLDGNSAVADSSVSAKNLSSLSHEEKAKFWKRLDLVKIVDGGGAFDRRLLA
jgi:hypothetical protein